MTSGNQSHPAPFGREKGSRRGKARGGRPTLPPEQVRTGLIQVRVSEAEKAAISANAAAAGLDVGPFLREMGVRGTVIVQAPIPEVNREAYADLARLGTLLKQAVHHGGNDLAGIIADLVGQVRRMQLATVGVTEVEP